MGKEVGILPSLYDSALAFNRNILNRYDFYLFVPSFIDVSLFIRICARRTQCWLRLADISAVSYSVFLIYFFVFDFCTSHLSGNVGFINSRHFLIIFFCCWLPWIYMQTLCLYVPVFCPLMNLLAAVVGVCSILTRHLRTSEQARICNSFFSSLLAPKLVSYWIGHVERLEWFSSISLRRQCGRA